MRIKVLAVVAAVTAGAALTSVVLSAEEPRQARRGDRAAMQAELGLSDEQTAEIRQIRTNERKAAIRRNGELRIARMELGELMGAATLDEAAIAARIGRIGELQATTLQARTQSLLAIRRLVTPEQFQKLQQAKRQAQRERPMRRQRGPRGPRGEPSGGGAELPQDPA